MNCITDEEELTVQAMSDFLKIFGEYSRIRIMECIMDMRFTVSEIAEMTGMTMSAISHNLKILKQAKLIVSQRSGKMIYYIVADKHVKEIYNIAKAHIEEFKKDISASDEHKEMEEIFWNEL